MAVLLKDLVPLVMSAKDDWRASLLKNWNEIVGSLKTRIRLEKVTGDMIIIGVYESHWMQELYLLSSVLIDSVNDFLGKPYIKQIRFKLVEERTSPRFNTYEKKKFVQREITLTNEQKKALEKITDFQLKNALIEFWGKCQIPYPKKGG
ncbi:DUF721 domain-containing protein [Candidatus Dependentiae bacterium]|nr:DUF721 domain-containing protein [Candidatus Dependentiae bacterium]